MEDNLKFYEILDEGTFMHLPENTIVSENEYGVMTFITENLIIYGHSRTELNLYGECNVNTIAIYSQQEEKSGVKLQIDAYNGIDSDMCDRIEVSIINTNGSEADIIEPYDVFKIVPQPYVTSNKNIQKAQKAYMKIILMFIKEHKNVYKDKNIQLGLKATEETLEYMLDIFANWKIKNPSKRRIKARY